MIEHPHHDGLHDLRPTAKHVLPFGILSFAFIFLCVECVRTSAPTVDEYAHVPAGVSYWLTGRNYLYRENPPLVRSLTAIPFLLSAAQYDFTRASEGRRSEWDVGMDFMRANGPRYQPLLERSRCVAILLGLVCGAIIFWWSAKLYGGIAGIACATMWLTDPNVLAHSSIATIDVGASLAACLAGYSFYEYLRSPRYAKAATAGIFLGLAQSSKFSMLAFYPYIVIVVGYKCIIHSSVNSEPSLCQPKITSGIARLLFGNHYLLHIGLICVVSILVLNLVYLFDETGRPLGDFQFKSRAMSGGSIEDCNNGVPGNFFRNSMLSGIPVPLPSQYILGLDSQKWEEEMGFVRLSKGRLEPRGTWYSPIHTLLLKFPLGTLVLLIVCLGYWIARRCPLCEGESVIALMVLSMLLLLCFHDGLNWPVRYALPLLPLLFVLCGSAYRFLFRSLVGRIVFLICITWNVQSLFSVRPCYISFANELANGPAGGASYFIGSNYDWGQDLIRLKWWWESRSSHLPLAVSYYGAVHPSSLGLPLVGLPESFLDNCSNLSVPESSGQKPFYWAISSNFLAGLPANVTVASHLTEKRVLDSSRLRPELAVARVGFTIFVFKVVPDSEGLGSESMTYESLRSCLRKPTDFESRANTP